MGARVTCVHVTPIPPLRLNKIIAWRLPGNPLSFFPGFTWEKTNGISSAATRQQFYAALVQILSCVETLVQILAPLHAPMDIRLLSSHVHGVTPVL